MHYKIATNFAYALLFSLCAARAESALVKKPSKYPINIQRAQQVLPTDVQNIIKDMCGVPKNRTLRHAEFLFDLDTAGRGDNPQEDIYFTVNLRGNHKALFEALPPEKQLNYHQNYYILNIKKGSPCHPYALAQTITCKSREYFNHLQHAALLMCAIKSYTIATIPQTAFGSTLMAVVCGLALHADYEKRQIAQNKNYLGQTNWKIAYELHLLE